MERKEQTGHKLAQTEPHKLHEVHGLIPGVAVINDMIVGIENRDGNTNVRFNQRETLERIFKRLEASEVYKRAVQHVTFTTLNITFSLYEYQY